MAYASSTGGSPGGDSCCGAVVMVVVLFVPVHCWCRCCAPVGASGAEPPYSSL